MPFVHTYELVIPANTTFDGRKRISKSLPAGVRLTSVRLHVPAGHQALVPVWVEHRTQKLLPTDGTEYKLDEIPDLELLPKDGYVDLESSGDLDFVGHNSDAVNAHTARLIVSGFYREERGRTR